jgi:ATP-dependent Clp protease ATP-binding subunit ClpA
MMLMAKTCDLPFFMIEGAEFQESHSLLRLVGSPSGYKGPDEGILFKFLQENSSGLIFIDEIRKGEPSIQ